MKIFFCKKKFVKKSTYRTGILIPPVFFIFTFLSIFLPSYRKFDKIEQIILTKIQKITVNMPTCYSGTGVISRIKIRKIPKK